MPKKTILLLTTLALLGIEKGQADYFYCPRPGEFDKEQHGTIIHWAAKKMISILNLLYILHPITIGLPKLIAMME